MLAALAQLPGGEGRAEVSFLEMAPADVSSSQVRELVARGEPVQGLVGEPVARYISEQRLYLRAA